MLNDPKQASYPSGPTHLDFAIKLKSDFVAVRAAFDPRRTLVAFKRQ
jgi:hypothetical protein